MSDAFDAITAHVRACRVCQDSILEVGGADDASGFCELGRDLYRRWLYRLGSHSGGSSSEPPAPSSTGEGAVSDAEPPEPKKSGGSDVKGE